MKRNFVPGCLADTDMRHYEFQRNTRLPRDTFHRKWWRISPDAAVFWVTAILGTIAVVWL